MTAASVERSDFELSDVDRERLRAAAERLHQLSLSNRTLDCYWGIGLHACKAFVWALFTGKDPVQLVGRACFGDAGLYSADPCWDSPRRNYSRTYRVEALVAHLQTLRAVRGSP